LRQQHRKEVKLFCEAITLLENTCFPIKLDVSKTAWDINYDPKNDKYNADVSELRTAAETVLMAEARKLQAVEHIPWNERRISQRQEFSLKMSILSSLLGTRFENKNFFK
jgi:hypothetical protein